MKVYAEGYNFGEAAKIKQFPGYFNDRRLFTNVLSRRRRRQITVYGFSRGGGYGAIMYEARFPAPINGRHSSFFHFNGGNGPSHSFILYNRFRFLHPLPRRRRRRCRIHHTNTHVNVASTALPSLGSPPCRVMPLGGAPP